MKDLLKDMRFPTKKAKQGGRSFDKLEYLRKNMSTEDRYLISRRIQTLRL